MMMGARNCLTDLMIGAILLARITAAAAVCETDWLLYDDNCYYISPHGSGRSFFKAEEACEDSQAVLTSITNMEEQMFINNNKDHTTRYWLGLYRDYDSALRDADTGWGWLDGSDWGWTNWDSGDPDMDEQCVRITRSKFGEWQSTMCADGKYRYICKKNAVEAMMTTTTQSTTRITTIPATTTTPSTTTTITIPSTTCITSASTTTAALTLTSPASTKVTTTTSQGSGRSGAPSPGSSTSDGTTGSDNVTATRSDDSHGFIIAIVSTITLVILLLIGISVLLLLRRKYAGTRKQDTEETTDSENNIHVYDTITARSAQYETATEYETQEPTPPRWMNTERSYQSLNNDKPHYEPLNAEPSYQSLNDQPHYEPLSTELSYLELK